MARGVLELDVEKGHQELSWYVGTSALAGTNQTSTTVGLQVDRDADFVVKRLWLVQWPSYGVAVDINLAMPAGSTVQFTDGSTKRRLSLLAGFAQAMALDANPAKVLGGWLGLPCPHKIRANNTLFADLVNPAAAATPWIGDAYLVCEGFKVYPESKVLIPRTIKGRYGLAAALNTNLQIQDPSLAGGAIAGQQGVITNNGEGEFLAKGMTFQAVDALGVDVTRALIPALGFNVKDSTSGYKEWVRNPTVGGGLTLCPAPVMLMALGYVPFNTPRYITENGNIEVQFVFPNLANAPAQALAMAYLHAIGTWPINVSVSFYGVSLPK